MYDNMNWNAHKENFLNKFNNKLSDDYEIVSEYISPRIPIKILHKSCGRITEEQPHNICLRAYGKHLCIHCYPHISNIKNKLTQEEVQDRLHKINPKIDVIGEYHKGADLLDVKCNSCGREFIIVPRDVFNNKKCKCPECEGRNYGLNKLPISITSPEFAKLVADQTLIGSLYKDERKYIECICPECNQNVSVHLANSIRFGFKCPACSNTISYPNRLMYNILKYLNLNFENEFSADWLGKYKFDFALYINDNNYIIEMDGGIGHGGISRSDKHMPEELLQRDIEKDRLAYEHNFKVIRIDSRLSSLEYIKNQICSSDLKDIIPIDKIDWIECERKSQQSLLVKVCKYYNETSDKRLLSIAAYFDLATGTISEYLDKGTRLGLCNRKIKRLGYFRETNIKVICVEDDKVFDSIKEASVYYNIDSSNLSKVLRRENKVTIGKHFMRYDEYLESQSA